MNGLARRSPIHGMPVELVTQTLENLSQSDLRAASRVSRQFYRLAQDAGLYIHRTILVTTKKDHKARLKTFNELLEHALKKNNLRDRPGIALRLVFEPRFKDRSPRVPGFSKVLKAVARSLPLLVRLEVYVPSALCAALFDALRKPAPRLRHLALGQSAFLDPREVPIPADLFEGNAHRLRNVCLVLPTWPAAWKPVDVFQGVTCAQLVFDGVRRPVAIAHIFPRLGCLSVAFEKKTPGLDWRPEVDLSGLSLTKFVLMDDSRLSAVIAGIDLPRLSIYQRTTNQIYNHDAWASTDGADSTAPLRARFVCYQSGQQLVVTDLLVTVSPTTEAWARTAHVRPQGNAQRSLLSPLSNIPNLERRLVTLIIDIQSLHPLMRCATELSALLDLYVDLTPRKIFDPEGLAANLVQLSCPALREVTMLSFGHVVQVREDMVALLGQYLKQHERVEESRAALKLMHVVFLQPCMGKRVRRVFSSVGEYADVDPKYDMLQGALGEHFQAQTAAGGLLPL
ncbi:hypothetical protein AURDEDRAFT_163753 [Auricularia subglabra TFB-10046 SS5]|nr:hypothetical protein AURDEDRAFT_163753 [Auricularia subglabra TFB-10046 SS5]